MWRAAFLPWPMATVTVRSAGTMSPPAKMPGMPVIMFGADLHHAVLDLQPGHAVEQRQVHVLPEREHQRVGLQRLELAGRLREALVVELHLLDRERALRPACLMVESHLIMHAFLQRLLDLEVVRRHLLARAAVDDDRVGGAQALGGARHVDARCCRRRRPPRGGRACGLFLALHAAQHRARRRGSSPRAGRDVGALGDVRADREEGGVEAARAAWCLDVAVDLGVELERHAQVENALHLGVQHVARQAVLGDAEAHHAAGDRAGLVDRRPRGPRRARW